jgi:chemotaxis protein MotB
MKVARALLVAGASACAAFGCVPSGKYDALSAEHEKTVHDEETDRARIKDLDAQIDAAAKLALERDQKISQLSTEQHNIQAQLDDATAINQQLRDQIQRLGGDVDKMLRERGTMTSALDEARQRLEELRRAQAAAQARADLFRDFAQRFQSMITAGQLTVGVRDGRLTMTLQGDLLFDPGRADVKDAGKGALLVIAKQLAGVQNHRFEIGDHTDASASGQFASNWDLSAARAAAVVRLFVQNGVPAQNLVAAGYADTDNPQGAAARRLEIALRPEADDLVAVPAITPPPTPSAH